MDTRAVLRAAACVAAGGMLLIGATGASAAGVTYTVSGFTDGAGSCSGGVCTTLRAAVTAADAGSAAATISLSAGTYQLNEASGGSLTIDSPDGLTITGAGPTQTVIKQTAQDRVIDITGGGPYLFSDLEVTGGHLVGATSSSAYGGGIYGASQVVDLDDVLITGNSVVGGNGANASGSSAGGNSGYGFGGGFYDTSGATGLTITDSTISDNFATSGNSGSATGSGEGGDTASAIGGGLYVEQYTISGSTISDNTATGGNGGSSVSSYGSDGGQAEGGGIGSDSGNLIILINTTVSGNSVTGGAGGSGEPSDPAGQSYGGGIGVELYGSLELFNDTVTGNSTVGTTGSGGNVANTATGNPSITIAGTVIADGSSASDNNCYTVAIPSVFSDLGRNLEDDQPPAGRVGQCGFGVAGKDDLLGVAPKLGSLAANGGPTETELPQAGSPLIRAGGACQYDNASDVLVALTTDQRGSPRGSVCDIGAVQVQALAAAEKPSVTGTPDVGDTLTCSLPTGTVTGDAASYAYSWSRGATTIAGADGATYTLVAADAGQQVGCSVLATGLTGPTVTVASDTIAIPGPGQIAVVTKRLLDTRGKVKIKLRCNGGQTGCSGSYKLMLVVPHGRKTSDIQLAKGSYTLGSGKTKTYKHKLKLSGVERRELTERRGLSTVLVLTPSGGGPATKVKTTLHRG
jgi:hypothetical protein